MELFAVGKSALTVKHGLHTHEAWEIVSNVEGSGCFQLEDGTVPFDSKTVVCIPPHVVHAKFSEEGFRDLWIQLSDFPLSEKTKPTFLTDDADGNISALIHVLYSVRLAKVPNYNMVSDVLLDSVQQLILSRLASKKMDPAVERIANEIIHHFQDPMFSLEECLSESGYCPDHMRRLFRSQTGKTPQEYLFEQRIKTAKKLLNARNISNYSVTEICTMVGFNDVSYFSRVFKRATGIAPSDYAEQDTGKLS